VAVNRYPEPFRSRVLRCLEAAFPAIGIVELPYCLTGRKWRDWEDAAGIYTNALETAHTVFVPTYQMRADKQALALYRQHSAKRVVSIVASGVSVAGGSLHCLSWVLTGVGARAILGVSARTNRIPD
jgi:agmatine/peptidylarginine deiminase